MLQLKHSILPREATNIREIENKIFSNHNNPFALKRNRNAKRLSNNSYRVKEVASKQLPLCHCDVDWKLGN